MCEAWITVLLTSLLEAQYLPDKCDQQNTQLNINSEILPRKELFTRESWKAFKLN